MDQLLVNNRKNSCNNINICYNITKMEDEKVIPNPYGANGTQSDPREQKCWDNYVKSIRQGRVNAYKAAIDAGYSKANSRNITTRDWFIERLGKLKRSGMVEKAEKNLDKYLDLSEEDLEGKIDKEIIKIKVDISKTILKTLGKDLGYSERTEHTGPEGELLSPIKIEIVNGNKSDNSVSEELEQQKEDSSQSWVS